MASHTLRLDAAARRALHGALAKVPAQAGPVRVEVTGGAAPVHGPDEVFVLVLGPRGGLVSRRSVRGHAVDLRELGLLLAGAEAAVDGLSQSPPVSSPPLTPAEATLLDAAGFVESDLPGAVERSQIEFELLLDRSLSLPRAARILGVNESRLRQRLLARTLYGIKDGRSWKVPAFQLDVKRKKLVRGIDKVVANLRADAHPLSVSRWFSSPHPDLTTGDDEQAVTPLQWLASGGEIDAVAELAKEI